MTTPIPIHRTIFTALLLVSLGACHDDPTDVAEPSRAAEPTHAAVPSLAEPIQSDADESIIRTYDPPAGRADEFTQVLERLLSQGHGNPPSGSVSRLEDDRIVVLAPASVHEGIAEVCRDLEGPDDGTPPASIAVSYWLVVADANGTAADARLPDAMAPVLEDIRQQDGPASFRLLEVSRIASLADATAESRSPIARIKQSAVVRDGLIVADLEIRSNLEELDTRIALRPGDLTVIGQRGRGDGSEPDPRIAVSRGQPTALGRDARDAEDEQRLYYIVRAQTL